VGATANFFAVEGADTGTLSFDVSYAWFLTPAWEAGIRQTMSYTLNDDIDDTYRFSTIPFINYNFRTTEAFQPYLGAFVGANYGTGEGTGTIGPTVGMKYFVADNVYIDTKYRYEYFFTDVEDITDKVTGEDSSSDGNHVVTLGFGVLF
jgi:hypothetical protein